MAQGNKIAEVLQGRCLSTSRTADKRQNYR